MLLHDWLEQLVRLQEVNLYGRCESCVLDGVRTFGHVLLILLALLRGRPAKEARSRMCLLCVVAQSAPEWTVGRARDGARSTSTLHGVLGFAAELIAGISGICVRES